MGDSPFANGPELNDNRQRKNTEIQHLVNSGNYGGLLLGWLRLR